LLAEKFTSIKKRKSMMKISLFGNTLNSPCAEVTCKYHTTAMLLKVLCFGHDVYICVDISQFGAVIRLCFRDKVMA
jgi:hypothetical protein